MNPPRETQKPIYATPEEKEITRLRVTFRYADDTYLYVCPRDVASDKLLRVRYRVAEVNDEFNETCETLWENARLNLLDVTVEPDETLTPSLIVLEPDYLIDISTLAECYKEYGHHPLNYILNKLQPIDNARPLLLGNIANLFLDEWIHTADEADYNTCMRKAFRQYPVELAACADLQDPGKEAQFFADCKLHFENIRQTVRETFRMPGYELDKNDSVLEPSYICEHLGLQGRLDYMQRDMSAFIEMKSGKANDYPSSNTIQPKENNKVQMLLYQAVLQYSRGVDHRQVNAWLLYTRYPMMCPARSSWKEVKRIIDLRNRIVANEYNIQLHNDIEYTSRKIREINPETLNGKMLSGRLWAQYLKPAIEKFSGKVCRLDELEKDYFFSIYNFITKEQYVSKFGSTEQEGRAGAASLWLSGLEEKEEAGEILYNLRIAENHASNVHKPFLILTPGNPDAEDEPIPNCLPNFRQGDAVILYERNKETDNVTNKQVFKGNIEDINSHRVNIRLRYPQQNTAVLPMQSHYAIERDIMDTTFRTMFLGLNAFLTAQRERRDLLLARRAPAFDTAYDEDIARSGDDDISRVVYKALAAKDYLLLVGPPGTGKTSQALRRMVEAFHQQEKTQILLLAYTNKAVDEICKALLNISPEIDFIRVGSELSCETAYKPYLMENILKECARRDEVTARISRCRVYVGTVATMSAKPEVFALKTFDVAIIDEATQILEPQLLGLLCAQNGKGDNYIGKFILIGDHKQLPAVVLQSGTDAEVKSGLLRSAGITNLKDSLFERLYRSLRTTAMPSDTAAKAIDQLYRQGRMHPGIAWLPNTFFYEGKLGIVGLPHQKEERTPSDERAEDELYTRRIAFFPSVAENNTSHKINFSEARIAAELASRVYAIYRSGFDPAKTLGIITPYRNQIALIRKEIAELRIPALEKVLVDTVERFQGSERDVIIYSFCVNDPFQLTLLQNILEENGTLIDRKLNVVLTRAREQLFIIGAPDVLKQNYIYRALLNLINIPHYT